MTFPSLLISIDPGSDTGVARYRSGKLAELDTVTPTKALAYLRSLARPDWGETAIRPVVVIEDNRDHGASAKQRKAIIQSSGRSIERAVAQGFKRGMDAGGVAKLVGLYAAEAEAAGLPVILIPSATLPGKWGRAELEAETGWPVTRASNEHQRDAARVGLYALRTAKGRALLQEALNTADHA